MTSQLILAAIVLGTAITIKHLLSLLFAEQLKAIIKQFPRSPFWGKVLLPIAATWTFLLAATTDLGEFSSLRTTILGGIIVGSFLFGWLVPSFLAVRSLGFLALLAARPILEITFLQSGTLPLLLNILAYLWIIVGFFMVGMPYLLRDLITIISAVDKNWLWKLLSWCGLVYGLALLLCGIWNLLNG